MAGHLCHRTRLADPLRSIVNSMSSGILYVKDSRTDVQYEIPIRRNAVSAVDFKKIKGPGTGADRADQVAGGLRVHDPGLRNTTVVETAISFSYEFHCMQWRNDLTALGIMRGVCFFSAATAWSNFGKAISRTYCISLSGDLIRQCRRGIISATN